MRIILFLFVFGLYINPLQSCNKDSICKFNDNSLRVILEYCQKKEFFHNNKSPIYVYLVGDSWNSVVKEKIKFNKKTFKIYKFESLVNVKDIQFYKIEAIGINEYKIYFNSVWAGVNNNGYLIVECKNNNIKVIHDFYIRGKE